MPRAGTALTSAQWSSRSPRARRRSQPPRRLRRLRPTRRSARRPRRARPRRPRRSARRRSSRSTSRRLTGSTPPGYPQAPLDPDRRFPCKAGLLLLVQSSYEGSYPFLHFPLAVLHGFGPTLHSSLPCLPSLAVKKRVRLTGVRYIGRLESLPRRMSLTISSPCGCRCFARAPLPNFLSLPTR